LFLHLLTLLLFCVVVCCCLLLFVVAVDDEGDRDMDVNDTMDKHWALRMLRLQLTVPAKEGDRYGGEESGAQGGGTQGRTQEGTQGRTQGTNSTAAHALFVLASHAEDGRLGVADVVEFCLGPLLVSPVCFGGFGGCVVALWYCIIVVALLCCINVVLYRCCIASLWYCITCG
jgi:hypothetical protein